MITPAESQFNISVVSGPSELNSELGHQVVSPLWGTTTSKMTSGFFTSLALNFGAPTLTASERLAIGTFLTCFTAIDTFVSDFSQDLSFQHEYAREAWEHEFNPIGEIDEYIAHTTALGVSASKARDIAMMVTAEPSISVPYHLTFELSMLEPKFYRRKLYHTGLAISAYGSGFLVAESVKHFIMSSSRQVTGPARMLIMSGCLGLVLAPVIYGRYQSVYHVEGSRRFKLLATIGYVSCIIAAVMTIRPSFR